MSNKYRKKPVVIEAFQSNQPLHKGPTWLGEAIAKPRTEPGAIFWGEDEELTIHTLEGDHRCDPGDWIIRGVEGELYPCKPEIFDKTYEPVQEEV